ncbi:unnamed protein product [Auanema sp. JU1783]|nr:unnamed protein product [Auanema sp. JU1783]
MISFRPLLFLPIAFLLAAAAPATPIPCRPGNGTSCGIHVFRVALSSRPEEQGAIVEVKPRRKYGNNVYAPRGSSDSFIIKEIIDAMPGDVDPKVRDRIKDADFVMLPEENYQQPAIVLQGRDPVPANFHKPQPPSPTAPASTSSSSSNFMQSAGISIPPIVRENRSTVLIIMILVIGIIIGILASVFACAVYLCSRKPIIDRTHNTVTYRKLTETERKQRETQQRSFDPRNHRNPMVRISSGHSSTFDFALTKKQHATSNHSLRNFGSGANPRFQRRDNLSLATSRDSRDPLM